MTLTRKLTTGAAAVIATLCVAALAPAEAEAARCPAKGHQIKPSVSLYSPINGEHIASVDIYYSEANGGTNTACLNYRQLRHHRKLWGVINIIRCSSKNHCDELDRNTERQDYGRFSQYAGPVKVTGTRNRCVAVAATIQDPNFPDPLPGLADNPESLVKAVTTGIGCNAEPKTYPGVGLMLW